MKTFLVCIIIGLLTLNTLAFLSVSRQLKPLVVYVTKDRDDMRFSMDKYETYVIGVIKRHEEMMLVTEEVNAGIIRMCDLLRSILIVQGEKER